MRLKWNTIKQVLQVIATIITTILGTIAVQSCI
ncbi:MAG: smalltalk protein [Prevotella sp.]|nr:smalltalk protein [Prevotella sp.]